jgi:hypothetical protein
MHSAKLFMLMSVSGCLEALGDAVAALPLFRRALDSSERVLGKEQSCRIPASLARSP